MDTIVLHKKATSLQAYKNDTRIYDVIVTPTVESIGEEAFFGSTYLTKIDFESPSRLERILRYAFAYTSLENIVFPASLKTISSYAFRKCPNLKSIAFPEDTKIEKIETGAFFGCDSLKKIIFPKNCKVVICNYVFDFSEDIPMEELVNLLVTKTISPELLKFAKKPEKKEPIKKIKNAKANKDKTKKPKKKYGRKITVSVPSRSSAKGRSHRWYGR